MAAEADDSLPTTASGTALGRSEAVTILRWVYPTHDLVTIVAETAVLLGRASTSTTQLDTERVSRKHAELSMVSTTLVVRDLESKNGTFVNGDKIGESPLRNGDVLRLGDCVAIVESADLKGLEGFRDLGQGVLGGSAMAPVLERVRDAASQGSDVFLVGESGTGKELLARAYHRLSAREGAFVVFDCSSGTAPARALELLGQSKRGAPNGEHPSIGQVRAADQGTLLLDEILDLPAELSTKLAEVMQRRSVAPLDDEAAVAVDVRFVAKSSIPFEGLRPERQNAALRKHFEGRIIRVPPLRQRRSDIVPLFQHLLERHGWERPTKLEPELVEQLCLHDWPMNVRELDNVARRLVPRVDDGELLLEHLGDMIPPRPVRANRATSVPPPPSRRSATPYPSDQLTALRAALERHGGNLTKAANELKITRSKAYRMLKIADD